MNDYNSIYQKSKSVITGLCGSGKSHNKQQEISSNNYNYIWVVQSTKQAIDALDRFEKMDISASIVVSRDTYDAHKEYQDKLHTRIPATAGRVIILMMANFLKNSYYDDLKHNNISVHEVVIDEIEVTDIIRPNLMNMDIVSLWNGDSSRLQELYDSKFSRRDDEMAKFLKLKNSQHNFISNEICNCRFNLTILTTEILIARLLKYAGFTVTNYQRNVELEHNFKNSYFINIKHSKSIVLEYLNTQEFITSSKKYDYVIGNKLDSEISKHNLKSSKGIDLVGNNLVIMRQLPSSYIDMLTVLITNMYKIDMVQKDIVGYFYTDMLLQAVGRSLGYRGMKNVDVLLHTKLLDYIDLNNLPYNTKLEEIKHNDETYLQLRSSYEIKLEQNRQYYSNEVKVTRENRVKEAIGQLLHYTGLHTDVLTSKQVKQACGCGVTLKKVADYYGVEVIKDRRGNFILRGVAIK